MGEYEVWGGADTQTNKQTNRHINTMTWSGLRAGPSERRRKKCPKSIIQSSNTAKLVAVVLMQASLLTLGKYLPSKGGSYFLKDD